MQHSTPRHRIFVNDAIYFGYKRNGKLHVEIILIKQGRVNQSAIWFKTDDPSVPRFVIPGNTPSQVINMEYELIVHEEKLMGVLLSNNELYDIVDIRDEWYLNY